MAGLLNSPYFQPGKPARTNVFGARPMQRATMLALAAPMFMGGGSAGMGGGFTRLGGGATQSFMRRNSPMGTGGGVPMMMPKLGAF